MNPRLSATAQGRILNLAIPTRRNDILTKHNNCLYLLFITPPGSFGERVRSRSERGGSCFIDTTSTDHDHTLGNLSLQIINHKAYICLLRLFSDIEGGRSAFETRRLKYVF